MDVDQETFDKIYMITLIRQLKLHGLVGTMAVTDGRAARIIDFFNELFNGLIMEVIPFYTEASMIFHKGGIFYMEYDEEFGLLYCRDTDYRSCLEKVGLTYEEIDVVIQFMVGKHMNKSIDKTYFWGSELCSQVDEHIKQLQS